MAIKSSAAHSHSSSPLVPRPRPGSLGGVGKASMMALCAGALLSCNPALDSELSDDENDGVASALTGGETSLTRILRAIEVTPSSPLVLADLNQKGTKTFKVLARYNDRSTAEVGGLATYTIDTPSVGTMTGARFDSAIRSTTQVDFAQVTVRYREGGVELTAKVNLTVAWLRTSGPATDLVFTLPYLSATQSATLGFGTNVQSLDTFLAVDTTGSMAGEIKSVIDSLEPTLVPTVRALSKSSWLGVGAVEDFPDGLSGSPGCNPGSTDDQPFILLSPMGSDLLATKSAVASLLKSGSPRGCGADTPEGQMEGLYQIATGDGNVVSGIVNIPPHHDKGRGGVEFRAGALPVVAMITDASFHTVGEPARTCFGTSLDYPTATAAAAHSRAATTSALKNLCARVLGISVDTGSDAGCLGTADLKQLTTDTGALVPPEAWDATGTRPAGCASGMCCTGLAGAGVAPDAKGLCPLVMMASPAGMDVGPQLAAGVTQLVRFAAYDVTTSRSGGTTAQDGTALPTGKTTADFLQPLVPVDGTAPTTPGGLKAPTVSGDHFTGVIPGSTVRFTVSVKNDFIPAGTKPQVFKAKVQTVGNGCATLDDRDVLIIVPAA